MKRAKYWRGSKDFAIRYDSCAPGQPCNPRTLEIRNDSSTYVKQVYVVTPNFQQLFKG